MIAAEKLWLPRDIALVVMRMGLNSYTYKGIDEFDAQHKNLKYHFTNVRQGIYSFHWTTNPYINSKTWGKLLMFSSLLL